MEEHSQAVDIILSRYRTLQGKTVTQENTPTWKNNLTAADKKKIDRLQNQTEQRLLSIDTPKTQIKNIVINRQKLTIAAILITILKLVKKMKLG